MSHRNKILIGVGVTLVLAVLIPILRHHQLKAAVARYRAELAARGEPMTVPQVAPKPVPPEQNHASILTKAKELWNTNKTVLDDNSPPSMRMVAPGKAMIGWAQPNVREPGRKGATNSWAEIETALAVDQPALNLLRSIPRRAKFDSEINYQDGFKDFKVLHLLAAKQAAQKLSSSSVSRLQSGDTATATTNLQVMLGIADGMAHDRVLISELVRIAIASIAQGANWELLQSSNVTDEQLAGLQNDWLHLEFVGAFEQAMLVERACGAIGIDELRQTNLESHFTPLRQSGFFELDEGAIASGKHKAKALLWRYWWSYPDELRSLRGVQVVLDAARQARTNTAWLAVEASLEGQLEQLAPKSDEDGSFWFSDPAKADFHHILSSSLASFSKAFSKVIKAEVSKQMTVTAIALKRFHLRHGRYPEELVELAPSFLEAVPLDPIDGKPLRYQLNSHGAFTLHSIGEDGVDNAGDAQPAQGQSLWWQNGRDWVWPQPATPEEIQRWGEHASPK